MNQIFSFQAPVLASDCAAYHRFGCRAELRAFVSHFFSLLRTSSFHKFCVNWWFHLHWVLPKSWWWLRMRDGQTSSGEYFINKIVIGWISMTFSTHQWTLMNRGILISLVFFSTRTNKKVVRLSYFQEEGKKDSLWGCFFHFKMCPKVPRKFNVIKSSLFLFWFLYKQILTSVLTKRWLFSQIPLQSKLLWKSYVIQLNIWISIYIHIIRIYLSFPNLNRSNQKCPKAS